jgi:polyhydroxybutyrate depolymerase
MSRIPRIFLLGTGVILVLAGGVYWHFLYYPATPQPVLSGSIQRSHIQVAELTRELLFYAPSTLADQPPLIVALHGATNEAGQMRELTGYGFEQLADQYGFLVVYPQGFEKHWNDCRKQAPYAAKRLRIDDVGFVRALIDHFHTSHGIDRSRVYVVGYSNGGHLGYRLALEAPELVGAVAVVAANLPTEENSDCMPTNGETPVLIINGSDDPINPYDGGNVTLFGFANRGSVRSARETATYFVTRNGIYDQPVVDGSAVAQSSQPEFERVTWRSASGSEVVLYTIHGGGHTFPQPDGRLPRILGRTFRGIDGRQEIWNFFTRHGGDR